MIAEPGKTYHCTHCAVHNECVAVWSLLTSAQQAYVAKKSTTEPQANWCLPVVLAGERMPTAEEAARWASEGRA